MRRHTHTRTHTHTHTNTRNHTCTHTHPHVHTHMHMHLQLASFAMVSLPLQDPSCGKSGAPSTASHQQELTHGAPYLAVPSTTGQQLQSGPQHPQQLQQLQQGTPLQVQRQQQQQQQQQQGQGQGLTPLAREVGRSDLGAQPHDNQQGLQSVAPQQQGQQQQQLQGQGKGSSLPDAQASPPATPPSPPPPLSAALVADASKAHDLLKEVCRSQLWASRKRHTC